MAMIHSETQQKADEDTIASGHCPECGQDLTGKDPRNHLAMEFPRWQEPGMENTDHGRRARLLNTYAEAQDEKKQKQASH